ncbi:hypothetical protein LguiB_013684 [Lonicera macranthoides]
MLPIQTVYLHISLLYATNKIALWDCLGGYDEPRGSSVGHFFGLIIKQNSTT